MSLGPYQVVGTLGAGGMGQVYRAHDPRLHRDVAIKVLQEPVIDEDTWARFRREARAASALNHPHICAVYDIGEADGRPFLVMELLEGQTLQDMLREGPLDPSPAIQIAVQIADALEAAHAKGVIHRDIKPGNIMIVGRKHVKVLDFGLAKQSNPHTDPTTMIEGLTRTGLIMGTPLYLAPEVLQGQPADQQTDLWSFGVVIYQMLSGRLPFEGDTPIGAAAAILHSSAATLPLAIPAALRALVARSLSKSRDRRFRTAAEMREALEALQHPSAPAHLETSRTITGAPASGNREANDAFALAMHFMRVQNDLPRGQQQLERALELDPHFAEARRYHAFTYVLQFVNGATNDATLLYTAEDELRQAEAEDPALASLPSAFAGVYLMQGRKEMIPLAALDRACADPAAARDSLLWRAILYWLEGDSEHAQELLRESLDREPLFAAPRLILGEVLRLEGDVAGAIREQERVLEQAPTNISAIHWLALACLDGGLLDRARTLLEQHRPAYHRNYLWRSIWALLLACEGQSDEARSVMDDDTRNFARNAPFVTLEVAELYAVIGDRSTAVEWADTAVRHGDERLKILRGSSRLTSRQSDARFQRIVQSLEARRTHRLSRSR